MKFQRFLKIFLLFWLPFVLFGCDTANSLDSGNLEETVQAAPPAVLETVTRLSEGLNISFEEVEIVEYEQVQWPDACLGIEQEGQACADVVTPGFRVVLRANEQLYEFRSNEDGSVIAEVIAVGTPTP